MKTSTSGQAELSKEPESSITFLLNIFAGTYGILLELLHRSMILEVS